MTYTKKATGRFDVTSWKEQVYVDVDDTVVSDPGERWPVRVDSTGGEPLALLLLDPALQRHPNLVAPAVAACGFALENYRLQAALKGRLREVQESRARMAEAGSSSADRQARSSIVSTTSSYQMVLPTLVSI